jgi:hypothetical protein
VQRTALNTEAKRLLLGHAFDTLQGDRGGIPHRLVQPALARRDRAPGREAGRRAAQRLPATRTAASATPVVFSIIESEWPTVRRASDYQLAPRRSPA